MNNKTTLIFPVLVNLITAVVVFIGAILFQDPIDRFLGRKNETYPLYVIADTYNKDDSHVWIDLFIINLNPNEPFSKLLLDSLEKDGVKQRSKVDSIIKVEIKKGQIIKTDLNTWYNEKSGDVEIEKCDKNSNCNIKIIVNEIKAGAIIKLSFELDERDLRRRGWNEDQYLDFHYAGK